jgi:four helix bundle protein
VKIFRFEELEVWQKARELVREIYGVTSAGAFSRDVGLREQIRRASVSAMANIAEGFERGGNREFIQYLSQTKGSCGELRSHLYAALDLGYLSEEAFSALIANAHSVSRQSSGLMTYLQSSNKRGSKYRSSNRSGRGGA